MTSASSANQKICRCGLLAQVKRSEMRKNSGKLFWGCSRWKTQDCGFFEWIEEPQQDAIKQAEEPSIDQQEVGLIIERQQEMMGCTWQWSFSSPPGLNSVCCSSYITCTWHWSISPSPSL